MTLVQRLGRGHAGDGEIGAGQPQQRQQDHRQHQRRGAAAAIPTMAGTCRCMTTSENPVRPGPVEANITERQVAGEAVDDVQPLRQSQETMKLNSISSFE